MRCSDMGFRFDKSLPKWSHVFVEFKLNQYDTVQIGQNAETFSFFLFAKRFHFNFCIFENRGPSRNIHTKFSTVVIRHELELVSTASLTTSVQLLIAASLLVFAHLECVVVIEPFVAKAARSFFVFYLCFAFVRSRCVFHNLSRFHALVTL